MAPAHAVGVSYAALGDSYSAGVGTYNKQNSCYQSPEGYPVLAASASGWSLNYQACSGATASQVISNQVPTIASNTSIVTVSAGGNDAGFANVMTQCALPGWLGDCSGAMATANAVIANDLPGRLTSLYSGIRAKAPGARVVVVGYPRLFNGTDCSLLTFFSASEMTALNQLSDNLAAVTSRAAAATGATFADARSGFTGHEVCSASPWINNLSSTIEESFHPNDAGNVGYEHLVLAVLNGTSISRLSVSVSASPATVSDAEVLAAAAKLPSLVTTSTLTRGHRAGFSTTTLTRLNNDLHSGNPQRVRAAFAQLHRMDALRGQK